MPIKLNTASGGGVILTGANTASDKTITVPAVDGTMQIIKLETAQTASGSSVDFTGIPSWVKRITVTMTDVSFAANGAGRIRLGTSSGLVSTGYTTTSTALANTPAITLTSVTDGLGSVSAGAAATVITGQFTIVNITGNTWQANGVLTRVGDNTVNINTGYIALSGTLDRLSLVATTSTFDAGTINLLLEG